MIYLDSAATTLQKPKAVINSASWALKNLTSPGRGSHTHTRLAAKTAYRCREAACELFKVPEPENVVFTFNATHALNIAINSLLRRGGKVVVSGFEHNAVMRPLYALDADITVAKNDDDPFAPIKFQDFITWDTELVVCNHVSNVYGCRQDIYALGDVCRTMKVPLIIDASQSAGIEEIDFTNTGAEFIAMPGHKGLYGPQGTGLLLCAKSGVPLLHGGTGADSANIFMPEYLPDRHEAGTHNMPGIAGLLAGLEFVLEKTPERIKRREIALMSRFTEKISDIPGITVYDGANTKRSVVSFNIDGIDCENVGDELEKHGIAVRAGLHCAPLAHTTGGTFDTGTVRVSVSVFNSAQEVQTAAKAVRDIVQSITVQKNSGSRRNNS